MRKNHDVTKIEKYCIEYKTQMFKVLDVTEMVENDRNIHDIIISFLCFCNIDKK